MDDAISRAAAIDALADYIHNVDKVLGTGRLTAYDCKDAATSVFEELPSAQPEIIHCESCEHWKNGHICECLSRYGAFETRKNFYCGYGKEKLTG